MKFQRYFLIAAFLISTLCYSEAADTLKINLTYKHRLNSKGQTSGYKTIRQQFLSPEGAFFREVNYNDSTGQIENYVFRFFKNKRLFTEECYDQKDVLLHIVRHDYDAKGNETVIETLVPSEGNSFRTLKKTVSSYNDQDKIISQKMYAGKKSSGSSKYRYNDAGLLESVKTAFKPSAKDGVKQEVKVYSHDQDGRISTISVNGTYSNGKPFQYSEKYTYQNGLLSSVKRFNTDGTVASEKVYKYLPSGALSMYEEHDATGRLVLLLQYDYKKHFMEMGTQKSIYEGL